MGLIADIRRSIVLARMAEYPCPGCQRIVPRDSVRFHSRRGFCPHCGGIILAPPGEPTGLVSLLPPAKEVEHSDRHTLLTRLGFLPAAFAGSLVLYLFWMLPGILRAAAVGHAGWRPIGWESTAMTIVGLAITFVVALVAFSLAIPGTRRIPGTFGTAVSIAVAIVPFAALHVLVLMPWSARAVHSDTWPSELPLVSFDVCASAFDLGPDALAADGSVSVEIENRSERRLRSATFSVKTARPSDWLEHNAQYRYTIRDVASGARGRIQASTHLGLILWKGSNVYGGQGAANAVLMWDDVEFDGGHESPVGQRPSHATLWPIQDCPGARRPEVPWYIEPNTGPR